MKILRNRFTKDDVLGHLLVEAISKTFEKTGEITKFLEGINYKNKNEIEVKLLVEGSEVDIEAVCEMWNKQMDDIVRKEAVKLIREKFEDFDGLMDNLEEEVMTKFEENLKIKIREEENEE